MYVCVMRVNNEGRAGISLVNYKILCDFVVNSKLIVFRTRCLEMEFKIIEKVGYH